MWLPKYELRPVQTMLRAKTGHLAALAAAEDASGATIVRLDNCNVGATVVSSRNSYLGRNQQPIFSMSHIRTQQSTDQSAFDTYDPLVVVG